MRRSKQDAEETRKRIVQAAGEQFRQRGIGETSLADLMAVVGLTHGGFYRHFASKSQLVAEACSLAMQDTLEKMAAVVAAHPEAGLEAAVRHYLSPVHRDDPSDGCSIAALASELAHADAETRAAATEGFLGLVQLMAAQYEGMEPEAARRRAMAAVATMMGALTLSRIVPDADLSAQILQSATEELLSHRE